MKFLLLALLLACGQNKTTKKDVGDDDGDNVVNALEAGDSRYIAHFKPSSKIEGKIKILGTEGFKEYEIPFSTYYDIQPDALKVLSWNKISSLDEYFSEFTKVRLLSPIDESKIGNGLNLELYFHYIDEDESSPAKIYLIEEDLSTLVWHKGSLGITIPRVRALALLRGKSYLQVVRNEDVVAHQKSIEKQSNRVFFYDGNVSKILYVSKLLSMKEILKSFNITDAKNAGNAQLLWGQRTGWWYRDHGNEKSIYFGSNFLIRESYLQSLGAQKFDISRTDGTPSSPLKLQNPDKNQNITRMFLRMAVPQSYSRSFNTRKSQSETFYSNRGENSWSCDIYEKYVNGEDGTKLTLQELTDSFVIKVDGQEVNPSDVISAKTKTTDAQANEHYEFGFEFNGQMIEISLKPYDSYEELGIMSVNCGSYQNRVRVYKSQINRESRLLLETETYFL